MGRLAGTGLALAALIGLTGCTRSGDAGTVSGSAATSTVPVSPEPADARGELTAAAKKLEEQSARMAASMGNTLSFSGVADQKNHLADISMKTSSGGESSDVNMRLVGPDLYMQFNEASSSSDTKWMHVDASKIPASSQMNVDNILDASNFLSGLVQADKISVGSFQGRLDMTKARNADVKSLAFLGDKAKAVPFTAKTDGQGRLTELVIDMAAIGMPAKFGSAITAHYSDFGLPVKVQAPAKDQVQEMPAELLKALIG